MTTIKNSILSGILFGLLFGIYLGFAHSLTFALLLGPITGLCFGIAIYFFVSSKKVNTQTQINEDEKDIVYSGPANHFKNAEGVGGKLYLLEDKIIFKSHGFNIQNHECVVDLVQIKEVSFYNTLGLIPNGMMIRLTNNNTEKFVVNKRQNWKNEISRLKSQI